MRGTRGSMWPCLSFFRLVSICFPDGAPLRPWLISAVKPQNPVRWIRRPWLETTALATSTARISSCVHKVIVALIGKAIPPGPSLARRSLISLGSRYRDFTTAECSASCSLCFHYSISITDHGPQTDACTCTVYASARPSYCTDIAHWALIKARNVASILEAASSCIRQVHREGTSS